MLYKYNGDSPTKDIEQVAWKEADKEWDKQVTLG